MLTNIQALSNIAGFISIGITLLAILIGGFYMGKSNASKTASEAQQGAITAMQAEINVLRGRTDDQKKEIVKLEQTIDTICTALKLRGLVITIQGEMVNIQDKNGHSSTTRISVKDI